MRDCGAAHLPHDVIRMAGLLCAAGVGHHAVGALLVAAVDDIDPRREIALAPRLRHILDDVDPVCC